MVNAIALGVFRDELDPRDAAEAWDALDSDFLDGHLYQADVLWRAALNRAAELSRKHSPQLGTRALDVLHVACALELGLRTFLTFDTRQKALAKESGMRIVDL
jgi:predicted nucleic acid-binding protein